MLKITAIGNLTNDVELKKNENTGMPSCILRIASDRKYMFLSKCADIWRKSVLSMRRKAVNWQQAATLKQ